MSFKMTKSAAILKDINPRKENHGEELVLAADLKLEVVEGGAILQELSSEKAPWDFFCWDPSEETVRPIGGEHFAFAARFDDHVVHVSVGGKTMTFDGVTLKKFRAKPIDGKRVELTFQAQVYPTKDQLAMLGEALMEKVKVKIDPPRQQDLLKDEREPASENA